MEKETEREPDPQPIRDDVEETRSLPSLSRRSFLGGTGAGLFVTGLAPRASAQQSTSLFVGPHCGPTGQQRRNQSFQVRLDAALQNQQLPVPAHPTNGDEALYPDLRGTYSKGLPHDALGEVDPAAFQTLKDALCSGAPADFEGIVLGNPAGGVVPPTVTPMHRMINPQSGLAFDLEGTDAHQLALPPAPAFASAWEAGEIVENYWMAHLRDVPFAQYGADATAATALADVNALSDYRGPRSGGGSVTAQELFRDPFPGCTLGPYLSQFFWHAQPFGAQDIDPRIHTTAAGIDYMTDQATWLARQRGFLPATGDAIVPGLVYMRNGRDLGAWVHIDVLFQAYFQAFLTMGALGVPANPGNPYNTSATQIGFGTLGGPYFAATLCEVATRALKAVWFQKWFVHRRLRPEVFAGRIHVHLTGQKSYDVHGDALGSLAVAEAFSSNGTYLLPMAFPEGSPAHPAYGAGHATVAGACVTILKALFDAERPFADFAAPVIALDDGSAVTPYLGADAGLLTVAGELNKLASNVATGRNIAGVHWRTDGVESLRLGEAVAISLLRDQKLCLNETASFTFRRFDGTLITI
jgi:hypothetical protein